MQAGASQSRPRDILFKLAAHMPSVVCCSSSQSFVEILLEGSGASPSSSDTVYISSSSVSVSDSGRYGASALSNSPAWGELMVYLFGAPPTRDLPLPPSARICGFMALFALQATCRLDHLCSIPIITSSLGTTMLSYCHVVTESVSIECEEMSSPTASSLFLYLLERTR